MPVVTLLEAKRQLRIESNLDDALLSHKISVAEEYVEGVVGPLADFTDGVPATVKEAVLLMVEHYFDDLSGAKSRAEGLLLPHRQWAF